VVIRTLETSEKKSGSSAGTKLRPTSDAAKPVVFRAK
jgi:hypothetical protein